MKKELISMLYFHAKIMIYRSFQLEKSIDPMLPQETGSFEEPSNRTPRRTNGLGVTRVIPSIVSHITLAKVVDLTC